MKHSHVLDDHFSDSNIPFMKKEETAVFCKDMQSLVEDVIEKRNLSGHLLFKVGIDSGGDFLKICCNVINDRTDGFDEGPTKRSKYAQGVAPKAFKDTSVN